MTRPPVAGPDTIGKPWSDQRWFSFVRLVPFLPAATLTAESDNSPAMASRTLAFEWWTMQPAEATALLDRFSDTGSTMELRPVLDELHRDKRIVLHEMTVLPVRAGTQSRVSSGTEVPYPPGTMGSNTPTPGKPPDTGPYLYPHPTNGSSQDLSSSTGTDVSVTQNTDEAGLLLEAGIDASLKVLSGFMGFGPPQLQMPMANFASAENDCQVRLREGESVLAAVSDALPPPAFQPLAQPEGMNPPGRLMILVVTWLK